MAQSYYVYRFGGTDELYARTATGSYIHLLPDDLSQLYKLGYDVSEVSLPYDFPGNPTAQPPATQPAAPAAPAPITPPSGAPPPLDIQPGLTAEQWAAQFGESVAAREAADAIAREEIAARTQVAQMQAAASTSAAKISAAASERVAQINATLQRQLQDKQITNDQYMQAKELAQQESQFARDLLLRQDAQEWQKKIGDAELVLKQLAESRDERMAQAQLGANPVNTVAYELYKRQLSQPTAFSSDTLQTAQAMQQSGQQAGQSGGYPAAPPAYSDETLQTVASSAFGTGQQNVTAGRVLYNPWMGGEGVFGVNIPSPNEISRLTYDQMDETTKGLVVSFLNAGIKMGPNGERVAINPNDYFQQMKQSFIPTIGQGQNITQYAA